MQTLARAEPITPSAAPHDRSSNNLQTEVLGIVTNLNMASQSEDTSFYLGSKVRNIKLIKKKKAMTPLSTVQEN